MALLTQSYLRNKAQAASGQFLESKIREYATIALANERRVAPSVEQYDIFLSHASEDAILIKALRDELVDQGYKVYVDWIDDPQLDRNQVSTATAAILRSRMNQSRSLLFATSSAAKKSVWMPWELGYVDARTSSRVAIVPMVMDVESQQDFKGQEYLGLYPYLDKTGASLYIHRSSSSYTSFKNWLAGTNPP